MQGQKVLFVGGQGPVSAPALRLLAPDNDVSVMARFSNPEVRDKLEAMGVTCIRHDLFEPFADLPDDFDYVFHSALPLTGTDVPAMERWPNSFVLPMYSSASAYRFRPLGPEETLMEIWSLTRFPEGHEPGKPTPPEVWECDDSRWPPIPAQDFSNLPRQQKGLHAKGFKYMRLNERLEGHISNFQRTIDGFLAGLPHERLLPAQQAVNVAPFDKPILDLGF